MLNRLIHRPRADEFVTEKRRPRHLHERNEFWTADNRSDTALVLQGPLPESDSFTEETVRLYRANFPLAPILVSTWTGESPSKLKALEHLGAHVLVQDRPTHAGVHNGNLQMASASLGVLEAKRLGASFVVKTRTDQRIYSDKLLGHMHALIELFPLNEALPRQKQRIVGISLNTFAYRMYRLSDMFQFGAVDDMVTFWNGQLDERHLQTPIRAATHRQFATANVCEVYFCSQFLARTGWNLNWTASDSWNALASRFVIADASSLDLYWPKYTNQEERWRTYNGNPRFLEIDFASWLLMKQGKAHPNESILDTRW